MQCNRYNKIFLDLCKILILEIYECLDDICFNGGTCQLIAGDTVCICQEEYEGINCGMFLKHFFNILRLFYL